MTQENSNDISNDINQQFWECVLDDIRKSFPENGNPLDWDQPKIRYFLRKMSIQIKERFDENHDLARSYELNPDVEKRLFEWGTVNVDTFRNIFLKKKYNTKSMTRDKFAVLLGYLSGEDYKSKRVLIKNNDSVNKTIESNSEIIEQPKASLEETLTPKSETKNKFVLIYAAVISLFLLSAFLFTNYFTEEETFFSADSEFKILLLPFSKLASVEGQEYNFHVALQSRIEGIITEAERKGVICEVKRLDTNATHFSLEDATAVGRQLDAGLVIWGEYEQYLDFDDLNMSLDYAFADSNYTRIANYSGHEAFSSQKNKAIGELKTKSNIGDIDRIVYLGIAYNSAAKNDWSTCLYYLDKDSLHSEDDSFGSNRFRAYAYYVSGDYQKAYNRMKMAIEIDSSQSWDLSTMGAYCRRIEKYDDAIKYMEMAVELDPKYWKAISNLGSIYYSMGEYEYAIEYYNKALQIEPKDSISILSRGESYMELEKYDSAMVDFNYYLNCDPNDPYIHHYYGKLYIRMNQNEDAVKSLHTAIELDSLDSEIYMDLALAYKALGQEQEALEAKDKAETISNRPQ